MSEDGAVGALSAVVSGRVQGVGFRWSAREQARALGLRGYVRNADDGSVELVAEGRSDRLDLFVEWLRRGPPGARVDSVDIRVLQKTGSYATFSIEP